MAAGVLHRALPLLILFLVLPYPCSIGARTHLSRAAAGAPTASDDQTRSEALSTPSGRRSSAGRPRPSSAPSKRHNMMRVNDYASHWPASP
ncbi:unnamed protein product [Spirodela intermedia]|uniref:Uncharacterized protein n=1 Tax=Spirodela intermedia TaxID=51605 RepID=A0A7I8JQM1_SPIIN|nr:unnamed protein product [Spirodela intermedia]CAA6672085.1 unnamed protein product [Spirodela intermedia]